LVLAKMAVTPKVLLPLIRRVRPSVTASQLIGVQPMTGPIGQMQALRTRYDYYNNRDIFKMQKKHYQHFIKAYNRRTQQKISYLTDLGYTCVKVNFDLSNGAGVAKAYCKRHVKDGAWLSNGNHFVFAYDRDVTMFALKFS
jgi:hypothetical protein